MTKKHGNSLFVRISELIEQARMRVKTTVDTAMVYTYFSAGRYIVMDEQQGHHRAEYGKQKLQEFKFRFYNMVIFKLLQRKKKAYCM